MSDSANDVDRLLDLADAVYDETASENEFAEMDTLLIADDQSRSRYLSYCWMHTAIKLELRANRAAQRLQRQIDCGTIASANASDAVDVDRPSAMPISVLGDSIHGAAGYFASGWPVAYLIATVIFAIGLVIGAVVHVSPPVPFAAHDSTNINTPSATPSDAAARVGRITGMIDCVWDERGRQLQSTIHYPLSTVSVGNQIALKSGLLEITYNTGAKVILQGPVTYEVESAAGGYLSVGKLTAKLASHAEISNRKSEISNPQSLIPNPSLATNHYPLFTITTPTATVTDLGTEFGVEVDAQGGTVSHVFRGVVEFRVQKAKGVQQPIRLTENQSARIGSDGDRVATILRDKVDHRSFVRTMPAPPHRVPIKLFNTGQNVNEGDADPNWEIVAVSNDSSSKPRPAIVVKQPKPFWMPNEPKRSQWISTQSDASPMPGNGIVTFRTRFELTDVRAKTARLHGLFIADNHVQAIRINGQKVRMPDHGYDQFDFFHPFTIASGFVDGVNVLEMDLENGDPALSPSARVSDPNDGTVVFHDDFESPSSASAAAYPDNSGSYDPTGASPGRWTVTKNNPNAVQLTTSRISPDPGAHQDAKYLRLRRLVQGEDLASARANFAAPAMAGDHIRVAAAVYVPAVEQDTAEIAQISVGNAINLIANYGGHRSVVSYTNDGVSHDSGLGIIAGKWQMWRIDYNVGEATCTLTIDGRSASNIPVNLVSRVGDAEFWANSIAKSPIYIDDVLVQVTGGPMGLRVELEGTVQQR